MSEVYFYKPYDLWRKLHYLRNEDYKTNDEQLANVCAAIEADRKAAQTEAADTIKAQAAEIKELRAMLIEAIERVEAGDLDWLMCCDGRMCGCQGSTNADHFLHFARAALGETK